MDMVQHKTLDWCPERESNPHSHKPRDFKSLVSTDFTIRAALADYIGARIQKRESAMLSLFLNLERQKSLELSTYTLARYRSTN